ncbi:gamma-aminobutyric acid receptor subunit beta-3-like isoform X2 [Nematostella vectensis]|uniref:gamma-aminobutyric acid receptor subunit beta-3-like isoform X2 n=1 Tax=Nematostella vectensis TaxID=45351 RepID=UPI002076F66A|nr:gamma-aminobutyric acid receptor subunit beta-3-like isoform X2 [Nematostella vectensis]
MDLRLYPMDTQHCPLTMESYAHTVVNIIYKWQSDTKGTGIEVVSEEIAQFELRAVKKDTGAQSNSKELPAHHIPGNDIMVPVLDLCGRSPCPLLHNPKHPAWHEV